MASRLQELTANARLLRKLYPDGKVRLKAGALLWSASLKPSDLCCTYSVSMYYDAVRHPKVRVRNPQLEPNAEAHLPHIYADGTLCLYKPGEWTWSDMLATTIVPWTSEWLIHYEIWRVTGSWQASGGDHTGLLPAQSSSTRPKHPRPRS
jgi:hypothetical protein